MKSQPPLMTSEKISGRSTWSNLGYLFACIILLVSCSPEKRLAKQFIDKKNTVSILLLQTDKVYKTNYKVKAITSFDSLPNVKKDSVWKANTLFLDSINDNLFINKFIKDLTKRIKLYGIKTYQQDSIERFLAADGIKFIVNYVQSELEEYLDLKKYEFAFEVEGRSTNREFLINALNINNWFDISVVNSQESKDMVFSSQTITDIIDGHFIYYYVSGDVDFEYTYYPFHVQDIINATAESASINAGYLFDYMMNKYIAINLKSSRPSSYYHYKGYKRKVKVTQDRFILLN